MERLLCIAVISLSSNISLEHDDVKLISSPDWPGEFPAKNYRTFVIHSTEGTSVKLTVLYLNVAGKCDHFNVTVFEGEGACLHCLALRFGKGLTIFPNPQHRWNILLPRKYL